MDNKKVIIKEVIKNTLSSYEDESGEWNTNCDIDFILEEPCIFKIFDEEYIIDRIKMCTDWGGEAILFYANKETCFENFKVRKKFIHPIFLKVLAEEKDGFLMGWSFSEDLHGMLVE